MIVTRHNIKFYKKNNFLMETIHKNSIILENFSILLLSRLQRENRKEYKYQICK